MAIEFRCIQCQKLLRVTDEALGKKARCPDCGTIQEARPGPDSGGPSPFGGLTSPSPAPEVRSNPFTDQSRSTPFESNASNPYSSPESAGTSPIMTPETAAGKVQGPATGILIVSGLALALQLIAGVFMIVIAAFGNGRVEELIPNIISVFIGLGISTVMIIGAQKMKRLESYGLSMTATVLAMLPCSGCCVLSMPFGIWGLVVLMDPQVKSLFRD